MGQDSKIEWTDHTFNPWVGCTKVSPACDHCYAEAWAKRTGHPELWTGERRRTTAANWQQPLKWNKVASLSRRPRVFCASLADVFDNQVPTRWRDDLWHRIDQTPNIDWLLLTKRPQNIPKMLPDPRTSVPAWGDGWPNVWLGTTIENKQHGAARAFHLAQVPAKVRFWSVEPLLEDLGNLTPLCFYDTAIDGRVAVDWVIVGGESGGQARHMNPDWARSIRDQCALRSENIYGEAAFFMKQMTKKAPIPDDLMIREFPAPMPAPLTQHQRGQDG